MIPPSGQQHVIRHGELAATITEVGAGIRTLSSGGVDLLEPFAEDAMCDGGHGQQLIPWPNRVQDGRWSWEGRDLQLPLTEPARLNASHGLTRWQAWTLVGRTDASVTLSFSLHPRPGWPFPLECSLSYTLDHSGLVVTTELTNVGPSTVPVACGSHPYLSPGPGLVDDCVLTVPADVELPTDDRGIPTGQRLPFDGHPDLIGGRVIDTAFAGLRRDGQGRATVRLQRPDGRELQLWVDESYGWLQVFTGDTLAPGRARHGLAIEPMSAPPNALRTGEGLVALRPGETARFQWGLS